MRAELWPLALALSSSSASQTGAHLVLPGTQLVGAAPAARRRAARSAARSLCAALFASSQQSPALCWHLDTRLRCASGRDPVLLGRPCAARACAAHPRDRTRPRRRGRSRRRRAGATRGPAARPPARRGPPYLPNPSQSNAAATQPRVGAERPRHGPVRCRALVL